VSDVREAERDDKEIEGGVSVGISLSYRYKSRHRMEIQLSPRELKRRFAYRSFARSARYYRVGDIRKAKDRGCSLDAKVRITSIAPIRRGSKKSKIKFTKVNEHKIIHYIPVW
jgi:hypothetical protein